jgi:two-component system response regulator BaeR
MIITDMGNNMERPSTSLVPGSYFRQRRKSMVCREILIVEDEMKIARILKGYLENAGYQVSIMERGDTVVQFVKQNSPSLLLLDLMIPGKDGLEVCREIRTFSQVPIIIITARDAEIDRLLGLELGADDYICKPFSPREVVARVKAVLRRIHVPQADTALVAGAVSLIPEMRRAFAGGNDLKLTPTEYNLLKTLLSRPNRIFSRNELINLVQGYEFEGYDRTIDSHVKNLRKKIAAHLPGIEVISTIHGMGYKLNIPPEAG